jgi:dimethylargininase
MLVAITRKVSPTINDCLLEFESRVAIDLERAEQQHADYEARLAALGARVISLPAEPGFPDATFVEDPVVVLDEIAVIARPGAESRRGEAESLAAALAPYRELAYLREPATLEGGDVLRIGRTLYVGMSRRTNAEGVRQLRAAVDRFDYRVIPVRVGGCLHLKTACCYLGNATVLGNRKWFDGGAIDSVRMIDVPAEEPRAANVLRIGETLLASSLCPRTIELLQREKFRVEAIDNSELAKAEAGLTCTSLLFTSS